MAFDYFYDQQIRRFLLQTVRAFSGFQYQVAGRNGGPPELRVVPCRMATQNRQVGHMLRNNSENTLLSVPMITVFVKEMALARERTQSPGHVSTVHVNERAKDENGEYTTEAGKRYTVDRMMPHPLDITIQVDVWTSNEHQKHQLFEQIFMTFNVGFAIQSSDNPLDWTSMTDMRLDGLTWSSRSIPVGTNDEIDVMSLTFQLPIWISPPAKLKQQKLIHQIVTNILDGGDDLSEAGDKDGVFGGAVISQSIITPQNAQIKVLGDEITLLGPGGSEFDEEGNPYDWKNLLGQYGEVRSAQSQLRLRSHIEEDAALDIVGTIQYTGLKNVLLWQVDIDTLPTNTLLPVKAVIDPLKTHPSNLPESPVDGHRYLILNDLGHSEAWGHGNPLTPNALFARSGDILEYKNGAWVVAFNSNQSTEAQYVVNLKSGKQMKHVDGGWIMAVDGEYNPGYWRLYL